MTLEERLEYMRELLSLKWATKPDGEKMELSEESKDWIIDEISVLAFGVFEEKVQRYSERTGKPVEPTPYKILTSLIKEVR